MTTALAAGVEAELRDRLTEVCRHVGISADTAVLIKYTMNAVWRVGDYVIRLGHGEHARTLAHRITVVATDLERRQIPTIRLARDLAPDPVTAGPWTATVWQYVAAAHDDPWPVDLAAPLHALHAVDQLDVPLPAWDPVAKIRRRLANAASLSADRVAEMDRWARAELGMSAGQLLAVLGDWCNDIHRQLPGIAWHLPAGPLHGDAHTGNVLLRRIPARPAADPTALLCDLDGISQGPREWDLLPTAHGTVRFGRPRAAYDAFAEAYGFDILTWSGWPLLSRLRELQLVTSVLDSLAGRPAIADEAALRLRSLFADDATVVWTRYH